MSKELELKAKLFDVISFMEALQEQFKDADAMRRKLLEELQLLTKEESKEVTSETLEE